MTVRDLITDPSVVSPQMEFNDGDVVNNAAVMDPDLPEISGPKSPWSVIEWSHSAYLQPLQMTRNNQVFSDSLYGALLYTWQAADGTSLNIYSQSGNSGSGPFVFGLNEPCGGTNGAGANLFLSTEINSSEVPTFNNPITYSLDAKITAATASGQGALVLAQVFTGFIVSFNAVNNPNYNPNLPTISAFMQVGISNSTGAQYRYLYHTGNTITYTYTLPTDKILPFQATTGAPTHLTYNLNHYLDDMIAHDSSLPSEAKDLGEWSLSAMYVGLENNNDATGPSSTGTINSGLQISNLHLQTDTSQTVGYEDPSTFEQIPAPSLFKLVDPSAINTTTTITADSYQGPLSFLSHADSFSYGGSHSVQVSVLGASSPLIATGSGNDILSGSATGRSILDGGTGANIEYSSTTGTTVFVANGYLSGCTWDFLNNFHAGDEAIIFGYIPGISKISISDTGGAGSFVGATVTELPGNGNCESITFVGKSSSAILGCSTTIEGVPSFVFWTH